MPASTVLDPCKSGRARKANFDDGGNEEDTESFGDNDEVILEHAFTKKVAMCFNH